MKRGLSSLVFLALISASFAEEGAPQIAAESVFCEQDALSGQVRVTYELTGAPAIVTVDFLTNGVSVGARNFRRLTGDVNRLVGTGARALAWHPRRDCPLAALPDLQAKVTAWPTNSPPDYLVAALTGNPALSTPLSAGVNYYVSAEALPFEGGVSDVRLKTDYLLLKKVKAKNKTFRMGITKAENGGTADTSAPTYYAKLTNDYYLGVYEVTQQQWIHFRTGYARPSYFTNDWTCRPVECVGGTFVRGYSDRSEWVVWPIDGHAVNESAPDSCKTALSQVRRQTGLLLDLPTEAPWEFAARAGSAAPMPDGAAVHNAAALGAFGRVPDSPGLSGAAVTRETRPEDGGTAVVGSYPPNAWGFYDLLGNVRELCLDAWGATYDQSVVHIDPAGVTGDGAYTKNHVVRGGDWMKAYSVAQRVAYNINYTKTGSAALNVGSHRLGFRVCLTLP